MSLPFTSLSAVTSTGAGSSRDLESVSRVHTLFVSATGTPDTFQVLLQGSHDGSNWFTLATVSDSTVGGPQATGTAHLVRHVRANLTSLTGGTSPAVTATIASEV